MVNSASAASAKTHILVDETIFIYATRRNDTLGILSQLAVFLGQSDRTKNNSKYALHISSVSAERLGMYVLYNFVRKAFSRKKGRNVMFAKRRERKVFAKASITRYRVRLFLRENFLRLTPNSWKIMDLHLFANENKRSDLGRQMETEEVIPMDICRIAKIAHDKKMPILSFNTDFKYFCLLPNDPKPFIQFWEAGDFLRKLRATT